MRIATACRWHRSVAIAATAGLLAGCSTAQDAVNGQSAGHQADGTYIVTLQDEKLACRQIRDRLDVLNRQLATLPQRAAAEEKRTPTTMSSVFGRMFGGPGGGLNATKEFERTRAESDALNALLIRKQCV